MKNKSFYEKIDCYCIMLRRAANSVTEFYDKALSPMGISVKQYSTLSSLGSLGCANTSELAEKVELDRSTLVRNLKPLIDAGLIEDEAPAGSRSHKYRLTDAGQKKVDSARPIWEATQVKLAESIGSKDIDDLMMHLKDLQQIK